MDWLVTSWRLKQRKMADVTWCARAALWFPFWIHALGDLTLMGHAHWNAQNKSELHEVNGAFLKCLSPQIIQMDNFSMKTYGDFGIAHEKHENPRDTHGWILRFTGRASPSQVELGKRGPVRVREMNVEKAEILRRDALWYCLHMVRIWYFNNSMAPPNPKLDNLNLY